MTIEEQALKGRKSLWLGTPTGSFALSGLGTGNRINPGLLPTSSGSALGYGSFAPLGLGVPEVIAGAIGTPEKLVMPLPAALGYRVVKRPSAVTMASGQ